VYPARWFYAGNNQFPRHFFPRPGELDSVGEEYDCAFALDMQSGLKHWVRNLEGRETSSMWLQTKTDKFYPDFVAELIDGRILMVEYKGAHLKDSEDTEEKQLLGELWEAKSNGKALFLMAFKKDERDRSVYEQIRGKIEGW